MPKASQKLTNFQESLRAAERHLSKRDPVLRPFIERHGPCRLRPQARHFETLIDAIISQQLSTKAADTILGRFKSIYTPSRHPKPAQILATHDETLRATGMSGAKVKFVKDLAAKAEDGAIKFARLSRLSDEKVVETLIPIKGIGVWTAQMFLIFSLGRLDVLPVGDLGVRRAIERLYGFDHLPSGAEIEQIAVDRGWRPYCSIASWFLWRSWEEK